MQKVAKKNCTLNGVLPDLMRLNGRKGGQNLPKRAKQGDTFALLSNFNPT